jgi:hypothetical protein
MEKRFQQNKKQRKRKSTKGIVRDWNWYSDFCYLVPGNNNLIDIEIMKHE